MHIKTVKAEKKKKKPEFTRPFFPAKKAGSPRQCKTHKTGGVTTPVPASQPSHGGSPPSFSHKLKNPAVRTKTPPMQNSNYYQAGTARPEPNADILYLGAGQCYLKHQPNSRFIHKARTKMKQNSH